MIVIGHIFFLVFIYLFLFMAVLGLRFCARAFSSCGKRGPLFITVRRPLTIAASLVAQHRLQTRRLSSCGSRVQLLRGMWDLPRPGLEPVCPALAGRFSTTAPPGKPRSYFWALRGRCAPRCFPSINSFNSQDLLRECLLCSLTGGEAETRRSSGGRTTAGVSRCRAAHHALWPPPFYQHSTLRIGPGSHLSQEIPLGMSDHLSLDHLRQRSADFSARDQIASLGPLRVSVRLLTSPVTSIKWGSMSTHIFNFTFKLNLLHYNEKI